MDEQETEGDRALLTVTAWHQSGEFVGVVRWRSSIEARAEVVTPVQGVDAMMTTVLRHLRAKARG